MSGDYVLGIDIGGTFTDVVLTSGDARLIATAKVLTTPDDLTEGAMVGAREVVAGLAGSLDSVRALVHATTQTSNAVIERTGARTALVTTLGCRDILELGRESRYDMYDLGLRLPPVLVPRSLRFEMTERLSPSGSVVSPLCEDEVPALATRLAEERVEAVAVCFLHSYADSRHEQRFRELLLEAGFAGSIVLSSVVCPEIREYERTVTTVLNAYLSPKIAGYLQRFEERLATTGLRPSISVFSSYGGRMRVATAVRRPVDLLESGAAAGVLSAAAVAGDVGWGTALSFDMGGTTAKAAIIKDGLPVLARSFEVARAERFAPGSGLPVKASAIDIIEIGAGGGSIARVDSLGLRVGPDSAGSEPGPACYGRGGVRPTVADADLVLGYLDPAGLVGGRFSLDLGAASRAIREHVAEPLGVPVEEAAHAIFDVVVEQMARAARIHVVEHGYDPRNLRMIAFGGAGPVHAAAVARRMGIAELLVMPGAGVGAALGLARSVPGIIVTRSRLTRLDELRRDIVVETYQHLLDAACEELSISNRSRLESLFSADMRYGGQGHEIDVPFRPPPFDDDPAADLANRFAAAYRSRYGLDKAGAPIEVVSWRLEVRERDLSPAREHGALSTPSARLSPPKEVRRLWFDRKEYDAPVFERSTLASQIRHSGPALVVEPQTTTVVPPDTVFFVDGANNLRLVFQQ